MDASAGITKVGRERSEYIDDGTCARQLACKEEMETAGSIPMTVSTFPSAVVDFGTSVAIERAMCKLSADDLGNQALLHGNECEWATRRKGRYLAAMEQRSVLTCAGVLRMDWRC